MSTYLLAVLGGSLMGLAGVILFASQRSVLGIHGAITKILVYPLRFNKVDRHFAGPLSLIGGMAAGGLIFFNLPMTENYFAPLQEKIQFTGFVDYIPFLAIGFGMSLSNGCASSHGLIGLGRCNRNSMIAIPTMIGFGVITSLLLEAAA